MRLVINASNVHTGGGKILLNAILGVFDKKYQGYLFLDERFDLPDKLPQNIFVHRIAPTFSKRLIGEWQLRKNVRSGDVVLCLGNMPPLFKLKSDVFVFVQNRYIVEKRRLKGFSIPARARIILERLWFIWRKKQVKRFIVQSPTLQRILEGRFRKSAIIMPFIKDAQSYKRTLASIPVINHCTYDFLYVASGDPHKNHRCLIDAWTLLAGEGLRPSLCLTLNANKYRPLYAWIEENKHIFDLNIENLGELSHSHVLKLYKESRALIYPSVFETIGLPLIEARCAGLAILASEMDYVRDVVDPEQTFDPESAISIARAVKRFLGKPEQFLPLTDPKTFIETLLTEAEQLAHPHR